MKRSIFSLRRLRWKLTLSYTLVTVVALLALELLVVAVLLAFLSSPVLPSMNAESMEDFVAPRLKPALAQTPPDVQALREEIDLLAAGESVGDAGEGLDQGDLDLNLSLEAGYLFVVDDEQRLLASSRELEGLSEGERFDAGRFPGLAPLVSAALNGEEEPWRLGAYSPDWQEMLVVAPVEDEGQVLGVFVAILPLPDLLTPLYVVAVVGAVALMVPAALLGTIFGFLTAWWLTHRLRKLARASEAWSRGDFSVTVRDRSRDELGQLSRDLNHMAEQLENLIHTRQELATLETRNRFARDLHDSVKQQVFATSLQVAAARALIGQDKEAAEGHLSQAEELARQAQKELNVLIHEMRPAALGDKGLVAALRDYAADWSQRSEIPVEVHVRGERGVPLEVEQALFRVAQEALANVARHSGAQSAEIDLVYGADALTLRVADDGRGFDPEEQPGDGFGLQSMGERMARLGGHFKVSTAPGKGTEVVCSCPTDGAFPDRKP